MKDLFCNGTFISEQFDKHEDFSLISLRISLQSYFETYAAIGRDIARVNNNPRILAGIYRGLCKSNNSCTSFFRTCN